jgi:transcriptional regulator with XRE-family HTH domain
MSSPDALTDYILSLIEAKNLSMRRASQLSGLNPETIGTIIRRGRSGRPRPATLGAIANALDGDFYHMMKLAGYLIPPLPEYRLARFREFVERLNRLPPERQRRIMEAALVLLEAGEAAEGVTEKEILPSTAAPE